MHAPRGTLVLAHRQTYASNTRAQQSASTWIKEASVRKIETAMKRALEDVEEVKEVSVVVSLSSSAKIHGVVTSNSPMKKSWSCSHFNGEITTLPMMGVSTI